MPPYTSPKRVSQTKPQAVWLPHTNARCRAPLNTTTHATSAATATPATNGTTIARRPAMIISTLSTIDHVVALRTSAVLEFAILKLPSFRSLSLCDAIVTGFEIPAWSTPAERVEQSKRHHYAR